MKILRIVYDWPPPWNGLAPHPYELTAAQADLGHEITIFCGRWPKAGKITAYKNVTLHHFWREPIKGTIYFTTSVIMFLYYLIWRMKPSNKVDVIHTHGHFAIWLFLYRLILKKIDANNDEFDTPLVAHFHNIAEDRENSLEEKKVDISFTSKFISWPFEKFANRLAVKTAQALVFVSEGNKNAAIKLYGAHPARCFVVESGVNTKSFKPVFGEELDKTRRELNYDSFDKVIFNNGQMVERKNIHLLVESLAYLPPEYKLLLIGGGDEDYIRRINTIIEEKQLRNRVTRIGYTPYPEIHIAFQVADIFVLPSSYEGLPKVIMQSLSCGVPVLGSGFKLNDDIKGLYYLDNLEPKYIAEQIKNIVTEKPRVDVEKVLSGYSWQIKAEQVDKIYTFAQKH